MRLLLSIIKRYRSLFFAAGISSILLVAYYTLLHSAPLNGFVNLSPTLEREVVLNSIHEFYELSDYAEGKGAFDCRIDRVTYAYHSYENVARIIDRANRSILPPSMTLQRDLLFLERRQLAHYVLIVILELSGSGELAGACPDRLRLDINPRNGRIERTYGLPIRLANEQPEEFVRHYFGPGYTALDAMRSPEHRQIYFTYADRGTHVVDAVWLEVSADRIVSMQRRLEWNGQVPENPPQSDWKQLLLLLRVPIQIGLIILALLHCILIFKKFRPRWLWPVLLTPGMAAGTLVLWYFANGVWWPALKSYNVPLYALYASNLLLVLLISLRVSSDWKNSQWWRRFRSRWSGILLMGLCLALVFQPVNILFAELARYYGAWWSGLAFREANLHSGIWPVLCFALILGSIPAISEELIYRELLGGLLRKWMRTWPGTFGRFMDIGLGVLCTSFVWGIAHLGYEVYPWYLRLLEFLLLAGPMQYIVWRRFGLAVSISFHFWINFFYVISFLMGM